MHLLRSPTSFRDPISFGDEDGAADPVDSILGVRDHAAAKRLDSAREPVEDRCVVGECSTPLIERYLTSCRIGEGVGAKQWVKTMKIPYHSGL